MRKQELILNESLYKENAKHVNSISIHTLGVLSILILDLSRINGQ